MFSTQHHRLSHWIEFVAPSGRGWHISHQCQLIALHSAHRCKRPNPSSKYSRRSKTLFQWGPTLPTSSEELLEQPSLLLPFHWIPTYSKLVVGTHWQNQHHHCISNCLRWSIYGHSWFHSRTHQAVLNYLPSISPEKQTAPFSHFQIFLPML